MQTIFPRRKHGLLFGLWVLAASVGFAATTAFPGAQGFGSVATGARGGTVYHVTNLNDSGTGSFRDAVSVSGRTIVFDVGGYVQLLSAVSAKSNLTIAGQTAPGGGFGVFGAEVSFSGSSNCIVRHMRFRDGNLDPNWPGTTGTDSHTNCLGMATTNNMIFDHCSMEFAAYNNIDAVSSVNMTFQNCIIADPIKYQQFNFHFETGPGTFVGNIFANAHNRSVLGKANLQFVNNVVYNYQSGFTTGNSSGVFSYDMINNYFIAGPSTSNAGDAYFQVDNNQSAYAIGNLVDSSKNGTLTGSASNTVGSANVLTSYYFTSANTTTPTAGLTTYTAAAGVINDLAGSGAFPRDQVDAQVVSQVASYGTSGGLFSTQADTGLTNSGYGTITGGANPVDTDGDGMPDFWESAVGLNLNSATDGSALASDGSGYTNLEEYLNWLAGPHAIAQKNATVVIDLSQYTVGLLNATYAVASPVGGTVSVTGTKATFTPTANTVGLGSFAFTATGTNGTITNTVSICTTATTQPVAVTWKGDGTSNTWDNTNASNLVWATGVGNVAWTQGDTATIDDTGSRSPAINLASSIVAGAMTVSTVNTYSVTGTGGLGGAMSLTVNGFGTGTLSFANTGTNTFSGATSITDATVQVNSSASLGTGALTLNNATLAFTAGSISPPNAITVNTASTITMKSGSNFLNGAISGSNPLTINLGGSVGTIAADASAFTSTFTVNGPGSIRMNNSTNWGTPNAVLNISGNAGIENRSLVAVTIPLGSLSGTAGTTLVGSDQSASAGTTCVYTIGGLNQSTTFAGAIGNSTNQTVAVTKTGSGMLTLSGSNTYTGTTTISGGTLLLSGSLGNTPVTVAANCSLIGSGTIGSTTGGAVTMQSGSTLSPGSSGSTYGTMTVGHGLTLSSSTITLDLSNNPAGANDNIVLQGGTLALTGTSTLKINLINGALGAGVYTLIGGGTATTGSLSNIVSNLPTGTRQTLALTAPTSKLILTVTGASAALVWTGGNNGGVWDHASTTNWSNGGAADLFYTLDTVTFNDTSTVGAVTISGSVQPVAINVNNSVTSYNFGGSGTIDGLATLTKSGTGTLTISNTGTNTFTGGATLNGGTLVIDSFYSLGTGALTLNGGTFTFGVNGLSFANAINVTAPTTWSVGRSSNFFGGALTGSSPLTINIGSGGVFTPTGSWAGFNSTVNISGSVRLNQGATMGSSATAFNLVAGSTLYNFASAGTDVTINLGALSGATNTSVLGSSTAGPAVDSYVVGALNTSTTFSGVIGDGTASPTPHTVTLTKVGTGTLTLTGADTYSGPTVVQAGALVLSGSINSGSGSSVEVTSGSTLVVSSGSITADTIQVDAGGTLSGNGTLNGSVTNAGTITASSGSFTITGDTVNTGTLVVTNGTAFTSQGNFINSGTLDFRQAGTVSIPSLVNTGTIDAAVTLSNLSYFYDGSPHGATVTTNPVGLATTVTYNGSTTVPSAAGTYAVVATVTTANYQGSATGTLVISGNETYAQWAASYSTTGASTTPQNDTVPNLLKYLYNINPTRIMNALDVAAMPAIGKTTISNVPYLTLTYRQFRLQTGITINLQTSADLKTWTTVTPDFSQNIGTDVNTGDPIVQLGTKFTATSGTFIRLNVTMP